MADGKLKIERSEMECGGEMGFVKCGEKTADSRNAVERVLTGFGSFLGPLFVLSKGRS